MEARVLRDGSGIRISRRPQRAVAGIAVGVAAFLVLRWAGAERDTDSALQVMGFDVDRAKLLTALSIEALVVAVSVLLTRARLAGAIAGMATGTAIFARTFAAETRNAAALRGDSGGALDPVGWLVTTVTLLAALTIVAWASATIAIHVRVAAVGAVDDVRAWRRAPRDPRRLARPAAAVAVLAILVVALPAFGDMVNYAPDVRMRTGASSDIGLAGGPSSQPASGDGPSTASPLPATILDSPTILPGGGSSSGSVVASARPWLGRLPSGSGTVTTATFPAPWTGGSVSDLPVDVYLPPGYATSSQPDPVVYEVPVPLDSGWSKSVGITGRLDHLIDTGAMPPTIVVFIRDTGGPFADAECADSYDGREWIDRYIVQTVVPWVDRTFRTIRDPRARAVMGFSQGGFCAAELELRHPRVFADAIAFSGYFQAGLQSSQTVNAARIFGRDPAFRAASSPDLLASRIPAAVARTIFFELNANPTEPIFGPQYATFAAILHQAGIAVALFPSQAGHAWATVRDQSSQLLTTLAQHWAAAGILS